MFWVEDLNDTLSDEIHLLDITLVADDSLTWCVQPAVHAYNQFIGETSLTFIKEMVESFLKLSEYSGTLNQVSLHFWCHLLVELEFFNNQVEIEVKGLLNVLSDIIVQSWLNMEWFVRLLNLFDPHVQRVKFFFDQIFEVI